MASDITIPAGKVIGIGKLKIFITEDFPYEIPTLSFLVAKNNEGNFISTCIQLLIDGEGETPDASMKDLENNTLDYLKILFGEKHKEEAWKLLQNTFNDDFAEKYWKAYRTVQLKLAEKGIPTDSKSALLELITKLQKRISDLEEAVKKTQDEIEVKVVDYKENVA